jgi:drug/metabolite transporter (DMT)-like permease
MKPLHLLLILAINLAWGFNVVPSKLALEHIAPITAAFVRFAIVAVLLAPTLRWIPGQMGAVLGYSMIGGALMFMLGNAAFASAENVSALAIAGQLGVPFSLILAIVFLGERIRIVRTIGILLAFAGVAVLAFDPHVFDERLALILTVGRCACAQLASLARGFLPRAHIHLQSADGAGRAHGLAAHGYQGLWLYFAQRAHRIYHRSCGPCLSAATLSDHGDFAADIAGAAAGGVFQCAAAW